MKTTSLLFIMFLCTQSIYACYCNYDEFEPKDYFTYQYIFECKITSVSQCIVEFDITENYKETLDPKFAYTDTKCDLYCGLLAKFEVGQYYLMYGYSRDGKEFYTDQCTRSRLKTKKLNYEISEIKKISKLNGVSKFYSKDSILIAEGAVKNKKREGLWKSFDKYGFPKKMETFKKDKNILKSSVFFVPKNNISISERTKIENGEIPGYIGKLQSQIIYQKDQIIYSAYYSKDGTLKQQANYKNGKLHGTQIELYSKISYKNGKKHGDFEKNYFMSKVKRVEGKFYKDKPKGIFRYYDKNGKLLTIIEDEYLTESELNTRLITRDNKR